MQNFSHQLLLQELAQFSQYLQKDIKYDQKGQF